ncbi:hypothetical protein ACM9HJ_23880 [Niveispirillum sp. KHB5.9]
MRIQTALSLSLLLSLAPIAGAGAQNSIPPLPAAPSDGAAKPRPPISVPATPDLSVAPLPTAPAQAEIPAAPVTDLPPSRYPGNVTGPEPVRMPAERSTLVYAPGAEPLPAGTDAVLADIVARLKARPTERLELRAHASGRADRPTEGRRTALIRVRALRDRLVQQGIDPLRLLVFADGSPSDAAPGGPPPDRVDLVIRP